MSGARGRRASIARAELLAAFQSVDEALMRRAARWRSPSRDRALVGITGAANYSRLWLASAAGLALLGGPRGRDAAGRGAVAVAIAAVVANGPAKLSVRRRRPSSSDLPLIPMPRSTSFPSGHSAAALAFATGACAELPILVPLLVPLAATVAYSRTYTGVHYPSDVAVGVTLGVGSGIASGPVWRWLRGRLHAGLDGWRRRREHEPEDRR